MDNAVLHKWIIYISLFLLSSVVPTMSIAYCYMYSYGYYNLHLAYCSKSCCGSYAYYRYCCYSSSYSYYNYYTSYWSTGAIVGAVIGGIIGLVVLVVIVACICHQCNKKTRRGAVIKPGATTSTVTTISTNQTMVGYSAQPPPQQPQLGPVNGSDPAYPPANAICSPGAPQYTPQSDPPPYK